MKAKWCPYCRGELEKVEGSNKPYCPECKACIYIALECIGMDSPLLEIDDD